MKQRSRRRRFSCLFNYLRVWLLRIWQRLRNWTRTTFASPFCATPSSSADTRHAHQVRVEQKANGNQNIVIGIVEEGGQVSVTTTLSTEHQNFSLEKFWEDFSFETEPPLSPRLIIGGRKDTQETVQSWLRGKPAVIKVRGDSPDEAVAFLAAVVYGLDEKERVQALQRAFIVDEAAAWQSIVNGPEPLILIPRLHQLKGISRAIHNGHHVFIPVERIGDSKAVSLPRIIRSEAEQALHEMGLDLEKSHNLGTLARRSLQALRRKLKAYQDPLWAQPQEARGLIAPLLVGAWQDSSAGDRKVLENLSGITYRSLQAHFVRWVNEADPPVRRVGNIWMISAQEDAWRLIAYNLTDDDLQSFEKIAVEVLSEINSVFELPPEQRYDVNIYDKGLTRSRYIREGITATIALMATLNLEVKFASSRTGKSVADQIVWQLLEQTKNNKLLWASIAFQLPLLAEASPDIFLRAVNEGLVGEEPILVSLFQDRGSDATLTGSSPHTGLLWALETLAWKSEYLGRSALYLAQLARLDPGGRLVNRPLNSLIKIFVWWHPNTSASFRNRLEVLDTLREREPNIAWQLLINLLPKTHNSVSSSHKAKWRDWVPNSDVSVNFQEYVNVTTTILKKLVDDASVSAHRWINLLELIAGLLPQQQEFLLNSLESLNPDQFSSKDQEIICDCLRRTIVRHHKHYLRWENFFIFWWKWYYTISENQLLESKALNLWIAAMLIFSKKRKWIMELTQVKRLEKIHATFEPQVLVEKYLWLFKHGLDIPVQFKYSSWEEQEQITEELRSKALEEIIEGQGWDGVTQLAQQAEPDLVGITLSKSDLLPIELNLFLKSNLGSAELWRSQMVKSYVRFHAYSKGEDWIQECLSENIEIWSPRQYSDFLLCTPFNESLLNKLESINEETKDFFWRSIHDLDISFTNAEKAEEIITTLLKYERSHTAVNLIRKATRQHLNLITPETIFQVLRMAIQTPFSPNDDIHLFSYKTAQLLNYLETTDISREKIAELELCYFQIHYHERPPKEIYRELSINPTLFVEALQLLSHTNESLVNTTFELLESWKKMPGVNKDNTVDAEALENWINGVREQAEKCGQGQIADIYVGQILSFSPIDSDGVWPHRTVRNIVEKIGNEYIEDGLKTQILNNRGVTTRLSTDGGQQERALAETYLHYANQLSNRWTKIASILRDVADNYNHQGREYDHQAELIQDFW